MAQIGPHNRRTLWREPLLHFTLVGAALFGGYHWLDPGLPKSDRAVPIHIGEGDVRWLKQTWSSQWLRDPTIDELSGLVNDLVGEQLLAREAEAMGLGENDTIIRRRLAQKLKFVIDDTAQLAEPTDEELLQFYASHAESFARPGTVSFKQIYFNPEQHKDPAADAAALIAEIQSKGNGGSAAGNRLLLGDDFQRLENSAVSGMFGGDFADAVFALEPGEWKGPIKSGYGLHIVMVTERTPTEPRPFDTVRDAVTAQWRNNKQEDLSRAYLADLRKKYGVQYDESTKALLEPQRAPSVAAK
ncbi:peptidyl-prolyl cis-trans isomerase [Rhizobium changzhiense]|uniref:Parvulin-like PPIase n=1 Tax=Rhizobium changzhiense TaxID=2692317 RepID=A0ABR6A280_9HYPH|nr:peptidylprolyl isomerase [Rhizobium changzhiense]MBA5800698.1 peptidyl-prolyl cis-trans isomerase [Rhizobium changzhiense]